MFEPNFSESQLQQAVNTALIKFIFEMKGEFAFANVPSLFDEYELGWDSAFYFPWIPHPSSDKHEGCNFFIQYKLSSELTTRGAGQWHDWGEAYLRFKIPHSTKGKSGKYFDDYHQWDSLKALADDNYPTFYVTNSTLCKDELIKIYRNGDLLSMSPFLDVRKVQQLHKYVTFTRCSDEFKLHSELEKSVKLKFGAVINQLNETRAVSISESNLMLFKSLKKIEIEAEIWQEDLAQIEKLISDQEDSWKMWVVRSLLAKFFREYFGVNLYWYPKNG